MVLARRLLSAASGAGSFSPPVPAVSSLATSGFWNDIAEPRAAYHNGKTYITFVRDNGHLYAAEYVHATQTLSSPVDLVTTTSPDGVIHNSPAILVRDSDKRIIVAASEDSASAQPVLWTSTNAEDATAFGAVQLIPPSVAYPTYPVIVQLKGVANQPIYFFVRVYQAPTFRTGYFKSSDGGSTWSAWQSLIEPVSTSSQYHRIGSDGDTRIDIFTTDTNRVDSPSSVYHMYMVADTLHQSDGTSIGAASAGPYNAADGTLVKNSSEGSCRADAWAYDGTGKPSVLLLVNSGGTTTLARHGRWTGSAWSVHNIADSDGIVGSNVYISSGAMSKADPFTVYFPRKVSGKFELYRYTSGNSGVTWSGAALTAGSSFDNVMPDTPLDATGTLRVLWGLGTYTSDADFDFTMQGYGV
jgi:hypothetical protein